jgi:hypothetical protein
MKALQVLTLNADSYGFKVHATGQQNTKGYLHALAQIIWGGERASNACNVAFLLLPLL